tara:strand:+ start:221 stop:691 length:471 start_codon:yes stop_codon:yes gene_type:complete
MGKFAENTSVSSEKSRMEIERILGRYGADGFMYGWEPDRAIIAFRMTGRHVKFVLPMPDRSSREFTHTPEKNMRRSESAAASAFEQAVRQRWRALALVIKAKLEAVETGITVFDDEFMAHIQLPNGETVGNWMRPQIELAYEKGTMPALLPAPGGK